MIFIIIYFYAKVVLIFLMTKRFTDNFTIKKQRHNDMKINVPLCFCVIIR